MDESRGEPQRNRLYSGSSNATRTRYDLRWPGKRVNPIVVDPTRAENDDFSPQLRNREIQRARRNYRADFDK